MFCKVCGKQLEENTKFCDNCGSKVEEAVQQPTAQKPVEQPIYAQQEPPITPKADNVVNNDIMPVKSSTSPIILLVASVLCCTWIPIIFAIIALVKNGNIEKFWYAGEKAGAVKAKVEADNMTKIGWIIFGIIAALSIIGTILMAIFNASFFSNFGSYYNY